MSLEKKVSQAVYRRDSWKCRNCSNRNGLDPHHVIFQSAGGPDTLNNLLALCRKCHDAIHRGDLVLEVLRVLENDLEVRFWKRDLWEKYKAAQEQDVREPLLPEGSQDIDQW